LVLIYQIIPIQGYFLSFYEILGDFGIVGSMKVVEQNMDTSYIVVEPEDVILLWDLFDFCCCLENEIYYAVLQLFMFISSTSIFDALRILLFFIIFHQHSSIYDKYPIFIFIIMFLFI
jgi:glucan phosphoethanolaminetransferase (alkaline phosphatase superfamily)